MSIFEKETIVKGKVVGGKIKNSNFYLDILNPSNSIGIPLRSIEFNKEWLDITIKELELIRDKM